MKNLRKINVLPPGAPWGAPGETMAPHMRPMVPPWAPKGYIGDHSEPPWSKSRGPMAPHMGAPWTPQGHIEVDDVGLGMSSQPTPLTHFMATQLFKDPQRGPGSIYSLAARIKKLPINRPKRRRLVKGSE